MNETIVSLALVAVLIILRNAYWFYRNKINVRILVIDDNRCELTVMREILSRFSRVQLELRESTDRIFTYIARTRPSAVVCDLNMPGIRGDEIVQFCQKHAIPVVLITAQDGVIEAVPERNIIRKQADYHHRVVEFLKRTIGGPFTVSDA